MSCPCLREQFYLILQSPFYFSVGQRLHWSWSSPRIKVGNSWIPYNHYENMPMQCIEISETVKIERFHLNFFFDSYNIFAQNIDCGYMQEPLVGGKAVVCKNPTYEQF